MSNVKPIDSVAWNSSLVQPRFSRGQLLEEDDLTAGVTFTRDLMKLMFRSLFGCGVICGLKVAAAPDCNNKLKVTVDRGLGLDCLGNPIEVTRQETLTYDPRCDSPHRKLWVVACYRETGCRPKEVTCSDDEEQQVVHTRVYGGYQLKLVSAQPECACSCEPVEPPQRTGGEDGCCRDGQPQVAEGQQPPAAAAAEAQNNDPKHCSCYDKHYAYECECACCKCIVLARIDIEVGANKSIAKATANERVRRLIRPALIAAEDCRPPRRQEPQPVTPNTPPANDGQIIVT